MPPVPMHDALSLNKDGTERFAVLQPTNITHHVGYYVGQEQENQRGRDQGCFGSAEERQGRKGHENRHR